MSSLFPDLSSMIQYNRPEREVVTVDQVCILSEYSESTSELGKNGKKQKRGYQTRLSSSKGLSHQTSHLIILNFKGPHLNNPGPQAHVTSLNRQDIEKENCSQRKQVLSLSFRLPKPSQ